MVHLEFNGGEVKIASLIDSGAACNCIRLDAMKMIKPDFRLDKNTGAVFSAANQQSISSLGSAYLEFTVNGHPSCAKVHVFENLNQRLILGRPWILANEVQIDLAHETIKMKTVPLFASSNCTLKPGEVSLVQAHFGSRDRLLYPDGLHGLVSSRHHTVLGPQVMEIAATSFDGKVPVMIRNTSGAPITIRRETAICNYSPLSLEDLNENAIREEQSFHYVNEGNVHTLEEAGQNDSNPTSHDKLTFDLSKSDCTAEQSTHLRQVLHKHEKAFSVDGKIGCSKLEPLVINLKPGSQPICRQPYRLPANTREAVNKQIQMLFLLIL